MAVQTKDPWLEIGDPVSAEPSPAAPAGAPQASNDPYAGIAEPVADRTQQTIADAGPGALVADTESKTVQSPWLQRHGAQLARMVASGTPDADILDFMKETGGGAQDFNIDQALQYRHTPEFRLWKRQNPNAPYPVDPNKTVPTSDFEKKYAEVSNSAVGSAGAGAFDAATLGFGDEIVGLLGGDTDKLRTQQHLAQQNAPGAYLAGELGGSVFMPSLVASVGKPAAMTAFRAALTAGASRAEARQAGIAAARSALLKQSAGEGAAYGAVSGAGHSDGDLGDRAIGAATGAGLGAGAGAAVGAVGGRTIGREAPTDYRQIAQDLQVPRTPMTAGGPLQQATQIGLASTPGGGAAVSRAASQEVDALGRAASRTASDIGAVTSPEGAGEALSAGATAYQKAAQKSASDFYDRRDALFGGKDAPVVMMNSAKLGRDIASQFPNSKAYEQLSEHPAVRKILSGIPDGGEVTLSEATEALSHIRSVQRGLEAKSEASGPILARVRQLKNAIQKDVETAGSAADLANRRAPGPGSAVQAQKDADAFYRDYAKSTTGKRGSLKTALSSAEDPGVMTPGKVFGQMATDMNKTELGGNPTRFRDAWFRLPEDARNSFAATHLEQLGRAKPGAQNEAGDQFSFNTFLTNFDKLNPTIRRVAYGKDADEQVQQIATYAARLRKNERLRNFSNTAHSLLTSGLLGTVGYSLFHADLGTAAEAAGSAVAAYGGAKLFLSTPAMRDWTKTALKVAATPSPAAQKAGGDFLLQRLGAIARSSPPALANDVLRLRDTLRSAFNGSTTAPVMAEQPINEPAGVPEVSQPQEQQQSPKGPYQ